MPIKKSDLEKKWYYRLAKSLFLILPLLIAIIIFLNGSVSICYAPQKNLLDFFQKNIVYIAIGLILYFLIITAIWRLFLYIVFGGLEDDTRKKESDQSAVVKSEPSKRKKFIPLIVILVLIAIFFALYQAGYLNLDPLKVNPAPGPTCHTTSAQWGHPCNSVQNGVGVGG